MKKIPDFITIEVNYELRTVSTKDYIKLKAKQLREFGYADLTEETVKDAVIKSVNKEPVSDVIHSFVSRDIIPS